jgi:serine phosphatase RsbU (regulator of sigma subunit)
VARIPPNMFVTCFYAILEPESGHLVYANAGHNLPCRRRPDEQAATTTDLSARGMPLGLMPQMDYEEQETALVPGEGVLFYTDGLMEAHNPHGEMLGTPPPAAPSEREPRERNGPHRRLDGGAGALHRRGLGAGG